MTTSFAQFAIQAQNLVKRYGDLVAVDGIDIQVPKGQCLGLLGPNGAGKTTTIEMLEGLREQDSGTIRILGLDWKTDAWEIRERIGVHLQETQLQDKLSVRESLRMFRSFYGTGQTPEQILEIVRLEEKRDERVRNLSGGQKQRLALGCALVSNPEILFLDEPTTGLDPQARRRVWEIVDEFKERGGTALLTTHYMDEAEKLADDVVIVDNGKVISRGSPNEIIASLGAQSIIEFRAENVTGTFDGLEGVTSAHETVGQGGMKWWRLSVDDTQAALNALLTFGRDRGIVLDDLRTHRPTLEDVFVNLTGRQLRDE